MLCRCASLNATDAFKGQKKNCAVCRCTIDKGFLQYFYSLILRNKVAILKKQLKTYFKSIKIIQVSRR